MRPPEKFHELLSLAINNLKECENDSCYTIDMNFYHEPKSDGTCHVCLAGAVIAKTLGVSPDTSVNPHDIEEWKNALQALNYVRTLTIVMAGVKFGALSPGKFRGIRDGIKQADMVSYKTNRNQWIANMEYVAAELRKRNI